MRRIAAALASALVVALVGLGGASARADEPTCADFPTQADAQTYFENNGGFATGLTPNLAGMVCTELPCPCSQATPPPPPEAPAPVETRTDLAVSTHHSTPDQRVWFTITRTVNGAPSAGKVMLQEKLRGRWHTVQGSRTYAPGGHVRMWYKVEPGHLKVRARAVGPESYSKPVRLVSRAA